MISCIRTSSSVFFLFFFLFIVCLNPVSSRPIEEANSPAQTHPRIVSSTLVHQSTYDDNLATHLHRTSRRAPVIGRYEAWSKRERMILGLGAGIGGSLLVLSILAIYCYNKGWHRVFSSKTAQHDQRTQRREMPQSLPEDTFQRHHESMFSIGSPKANLRMSYGTESIASYPCPYHPGLPSPLISYYQPIEVHRALVPPNNTPTQMEERSIQPEQTNTQPEVPIMQNEEPKAPIEKPDIQHEEPNTPTTPTTPITPTASSPVTIRPSHHSYNSQDYRFDFSPPTPSDAEISPRTIPPPSRRRIHAPQPRRAGLPPNVQAGFSLGIGIPLRPLPAVKLRSLPLREYTENHP